MVFVMHAPHQISIRFAMQGCRVRKGGEILADIGRFSFVLLKLYPRRFCGKPAQLADQSHQVFLIAINCH
ncbi:hypothetical protein D3C86_2211280 [compost metagenome]